MKGQFKVGDSVRVKYGIKSSDDILDEYWDHVGKISIKSIIGKTLVIKEVLQVTSTQIIRLVGSIYSYPAELFELVSTELFELVSSQHSSSPREDIQPGDYIYIREAGGWGYSHTDDYTIAEVTNVESYRGKSELGRGFGGTLLKNGRRFHNIPEFNRRGEVIVTKATRDDFERCNLPLPSDYNDSYSSTLAPSVTKMDLNPLPRERKEKRVEVQSTRNLTV